MPNEATLEEFHQQIESEITDSARNSAGSGEFRENVLTEMLSDELSESGVLESPVVCHYEGGKAAGSMKANGYSVPEEDSRLDLFVTIYCGPADQTTTINAADVDAAFRKLERFLGKALDALHKELEPASNQYQMAERIQQLKGQIDRVCFYLFTNARLAQRKEKERRSDVSGMAATYEVWDLERFRRLRASGASFERLVVDLRHLDGGGLPCVVLDKDKHGLKTCVTVFPGRLLSDLYDEYGARLLELNVRSYLQARGKVNKGILQTVREHPQDFMSYNNGITVVAEEVVFGPLQTGHQGLLELRGMQIVNGGQTTASIHRAAKEFGADLSRVFVQSKVTVVDPERFREVVPLISRYSNTQNKVSEADLSANHPYHIGIERVSRREWSPDQRTMWFYERARGSYQTAKARDGNTPARRRQFEEKFPPQQKFTKEDLAKFENSWLGLPYIVSKGAQKNFVYSMQQLDNQKYKEGWEATPEEFHRMVAKGILFREAQRLVRQDETITAYQINVVTYAVALLAHKTARRIDLDAIWRTQNVSPATSKTLAEWVPVVFKNLPHLAEEKGRHIGESFKSEDCWHYVSELDLRVPPDLESELLAVGEQLEQGIVSDRDRRGRKLNQDDQNNIARCIELNEAFWTALAKWGQTTGKLADRQRDIARTIGTYAAEGWKKMPTKRQAYRCIEMIELAKDEGFVFQAKA